jgi:hypothetical protein
MEKRGERCGGYACIFAEWLGAKSSFQVSFRPSPPRPYARGDRRRTVGYARYSDGVAMGSEASIGVSMRTPETLSPHSPPLFRSSLSHRVAAGGWRRAEEWSRRRWILVEQTEKGSDRSGGGGEEWISGDI